MKRRFWYWITDALGALLLLGISVFVLLRWQSIPVQVPAHFGAGGQITGYGNKASDLGMLLVLAWVMFVGMQVLAFFPQSWNIPRRTPRAYQAAADALAALRLCLALIFGYLLFCTALGRGLGAWFFPLMLVFVGGSVLYMLIGALRG